MLPWKFVGFVAGTENRICIKKPACSAQNLLEGWEVENGIEMKVPAKTKLCLASVPNKKPLNQIGMAENMKQHLFS